MSDYKELVKELRSKHIEDRYKRLTLDAADAIEKLCERPSMTDYTELVRKMRTCIGDKKCFEKECRYWSELGCMDGNICCDAAAAIEDLIESVHIRDKISDELNHYIWKLEAEVKRLKEVIDELREAQTYIDHYGDTWMTSAKDVPTAAYEHGYADGRDEAMAKMEAQDGQ